jgi:hypothetical protein
LWIEYYEHTLRANTEHMNQARQSMLGGSRRSFEKDMVLATSGIANIVAKLLNSIAASRQIEIKPRGMEVSTFKQEEAPVKISHDPSLINGWGTRVKTV